MVDVDLRSLLSSMEEVVPQCPVCLELVKPPVTLCVNGHGVCTTCKETLTKCPTCSKPFCSTEPKMLDENLQKLHNNVCKYYDEGCRNPATDDHELYCWYRPVKCIFHKENSSEYCDWEGTAEEFYDHVHCIDHLEPDHTGSTTFRFREFKDFDQTQSLYFTIEPENQLFILNHKKINGNFCFYIKHFPLEKPTVITYFILSFGKSADKVMYQYKMKVTTMITPERDVKVEENVYCMRVPVEELEKLVDEVGDLYMNYEITTESL